MKRNQKFQSNNRSNRVPNRSATLKNIKKRVHRAELTVAQAYDIVAGYRPSSKETFDRAVKVLRDNKVNKRFISLLIDMHKKNVSFNDVAPSVYAKNLQTAYAIFNNSKQWEKVVSADEEVRKALGNTAIRGNNGIIIDEDRQNMDTVIVNTGILNAVDAILVSPEIVDASKENIRKTVTDHTLHIITTQRAEELKDHADDIDRLNRASNFDEHVEVEGNRFISLWNKCKRNVQARIEAATKSAAKEVKIYANKCRKAAAIFLAGITLTASLASCGPNRSPVPQNKKIEIVDSPKVNKQTPAPVQESKQEVKEVTADKVAVPTEYSDDMNLPHGKWSFDNIKKYFGERFEQAYQNIPESLLTNEDGSVKLNRMQFLNQLRGHNEMNTDGAKKVVTSLTTINPDDACDYVAPEKLTKEDVSFIFTAIPGGDREVNATGLTYNDCTPTRNYKKIVKEVAPDTLQILPDTLNNNALSNDSITITDGAGEVRLNSDTTKVNAPSKALEAQYLQNNVSSDGTATDTLAIRNASLDEIVNGVKVDAGKKIKVEGQRAETSADQPGNPNGVHVDYMKGDDKGLTQVVDSANISDVLGLNVDGQKKIKVSDTGNSTDNSGKTTTKSTSSSFTSAGETITFEDVDSTSITSSPKIDNFVSTTIEQSDSVEIVFGTDSVEIGTPSAGYVDARGGYNNTGLSKSTIDIDRTFFEDKYGKGAYDAYLEKLKAHPEFFANGGAFGGWVPEQPLHGWRTLEKWGDNDINNKNADPKIVAVNVTMENFMDSKCGKDSLTADEHAFMFDVFSNVTTTGRIFGVDGNRAVWNPKLRANDDCDTPSTRVIEPTDRAVSGPWGKMMPRIFMKDLPITINEGQGEVLINTFVEQKEVPSKVAGAQYEQSNMNSKGKITDTKVKKKVPVDYVVKTVKVNGKKHFKVQKRNLTLKQYKEMKNKTK